jgi:hypothetical protein
MMSLSAAGAVTALAAVICGMIAVPAAVVMGAATAMSQLSGCIIVGVRIVMGTVEH